MMAGAMRSAVWASGRGEAGRLVGEPLFAVGGVQAAGRGEAGLR
jgi:hypothetical protein